MSRGQFYFQWLKKAFTGSLSWVQLIAFFFTIGGGAVAYFVPQWESSVPVVVWAGSAVVLVIAVMAGIFKAPYMMNKEKEHAYDQLAQQLDQRLAMVVQGDVVLGERDKTAIVRVTKQGEGTELIRNCTGYLRAVYAEVDGNLEKMTRIPTVYLQWSARHGGIDSKAIDFNREAELYVAVLHSTPTGRLNIIPFDRTLAGQFWLEECSFYIFDIEIAAENSPAVRCSYRLTIDPLGLRANPDEQGGFTDGPLPELKFEVVDTP